METHLPDLKFIDKFFKDCTDLINGNDLCISLAAGPLRVEIAILSYLFKTIEVNDISSKLKDTWVKLAPKFEKPGMWRGMKRIGRIGKMHAGMNMKDVPFTDKLINCLFMNWGLNYLEYDDALNLLKRAKPALTFKTGKQGTIILKETIRVSGDRPFKCGD